MTPIKPKAEENCFCFSFVISSSSPVTEEMPSKTGGRRGSQTETRWQQKCVKQYAGRKEAKDENRDAHGSSSGSANHILQNPNPNQAGRYQMSPKRPNLVEGRYLLITYLLESHRPTNQPECEQRQGTFLYWLEMSSNILCRNAMGPLCIVLKCHTTFHVGIPRGPFCNVLKCQRTFHAGMA